jgi:uncharacterized protein (UPF0548 family)
MLHRPSAAEIDRFLNESRELPLSYEPVGLAQHGSSAFNTDELTTIVGQGEEAFVRAKRALASWKHFERGWVELFPKGASIAPGSIVAVLIQAVGLWSINGCRVVYSVNSDDGYRFGFAYGTLTNHGESGEEIFEVSLRPETAQVRYVIRAVARPHAPLARMAYPVTRSL